MISEFEKEIHMLQEFGNPCPRWLTELCLDLDGITPDLICHAGLPFPAGEFHKMRPTFAEASFSKALGNKPTSFL